MNTFYLTGPENGRCCWREPSAGMTEVLAVKACGICHSDRKAFQTPPAGIEYQGGETGLEKLESLLKEIGE